MRFVRHYRVARSNWRVVEPRPTSGILSGNLRLTNSGLVMRTLPVYWHEGMLLRQHHFQASDRYWADQVAQSSRWDVAYNWGVRRIQIDPNALTNYRFVVSSLQARMRDGTIIRVPQDASLPELDLRAAFSNQDRIAWSAFSWACVVVSKRREASESAVNRCSNSARAMFFSMPSSSIRT